MPPAFMAYPHIIDFLEPETFFPYRDRDPQGALIVLEAVSRNPGGAPRELDFVQEDEDVGHGRFVEKAGIRGKIRLTGRKDHR